MITVNTLQTIKNKVRRLHRRQNTNNNNNRWWKQCIRHMQKERKKNGTVSIKHIIKRSQLHTGWMVNSEYFYGSLALMIFVRLKMFLK